MTTRNRRKGRIEALQYAEEVIRRRGAGESLSWIYGDLVERGEVTVSYSSFARWVQKTDSGELRTPTRMNAPSALDTSTASPTGSQSGQKRSHDSTAPVVKDRSERRAPAHGIVGVPRSGPINTTPNPDELY